MQTIIKGEKRHIGMKVTRRTGGSFTIDTATFDVDGIQSGTCEIDQGTKEVYFLIDTTDQNFRKQRTYTAEFTVTIEGMDKVIKGHVPVMIR